MREILIRTTREVEVPAEALHALRKSSFEQWKEAELTTSVTNCPVQTLARYLVGKAVFVAHDAKTGELLAMQEAEVERFRKAGYRFLAGATGIPAVWSVRWHLKNGYYITGYKRSEGNNYASYTFLKPIALDVLHHPTDIFWTRPLAPITAKLQDFVSFIITSLVKDRQGRLTWLGRRIKKGI